MYATSDEPRAALINGKPLSRSVFWLLRSYGAWALATSAFRSVRRLFILDCFEAPAVFRALMGSSPSLRTYSLV